MAQRDENLIWIDLEMTGLDVNNDHIIEIATIITDSNLSIIAEGPAIAIHQPDDILHKMDKWNTEHHGQSGLLERVRQSIYSVKEAEKQTLEFIKQYVPAGGSPMCGNTVCQDRRFLYREMPSLEKYFHYRMLDVSTVKILCQRWAPAISEGMKKESQHLALADIRDSIDELKYYREHFIR